MKVLQLTSHFYPNLGGVETHLNDLVSELQKRNFTIFVLTYVPLTTRVKYKLFEKQKNLFILRIPWFSGLFYRLVNKPILEFLYLFPALFIITPFVLLIFKPDVIHSHGLIAGTAGVFWGKVFRKKVIMTTHSIYHFPDTGLYYIFVSWLFGLSDHILALSKQSKAEIEKLKIPAEKISVFTYWVDQQRFRPMNKEVQRKKLQLNKFFAVLFVGRLIEEKGVLVLLDAFRQTGNEVCLLIAGDGPLRSVIEAYVNGNKNVRYLGRVDQEFLPSLYNAADVLVVPSVHEEGFGRIILESLSCGTPVIASKRGGIVEAMDESVGVLIPITVHNLRKAIKDIKKRKFKKETIFSFAKKRFSINNINVIINAYAQ